LPLVLFKYNYFVAKQATDCLYHKFTQNMTINNDPKIAIPNITNEKTC